MSSQVSVKTELSAQPLYKFVVLVSVFVMAMFTFLVSSPAYAAGNPITINQCNDVTADNIGGRNVECNVVVENQLNTATGVESSSVTTTTCSGFANEEPVCIVNTVNSNEIVTTVTQCDSAGNGGGGTVTCNVTVTNNIVGVATVDIATVNQCVASGQEGGTEPTIRCNPEDASTTGATVTQCNGSGNGGGGTLRVLCNVLDSSSNSVLPVTINQCNTSGNGGGGYVTCNASLRSIVTAIPPVVTPPVTPPVVTPPGGETPSNPETPGTPPGGTTPPVTPPGGSTPPTTPPGLAETGFSGNALLLGGGMSVMLGAVLFFAARKIKV